jgi:hypothetical protein
MTRDKCTVWPDGAHRITYNVGQSNPSQTTFCCACGEEIVEYEDCGTGA